MQVVGVARRPGDQRRVLAPEVGSIPGQARHGRSLRHQRRRGPVTRLARTVVSYVRSCQYLSSDDV
jgi:hypothetical protein